MNNLPIASNLPVHYLAACFDNTTNSYKFYWFLAILGYLYKYQERKIPLKSLLAEMISHVWYPINYFNLSFGKQDRLAMITSRIKQETTLQIDSKRNDAFKVIHDHLSYILDTEIKKDVSSLSRFVPYRFLSPWFANELRAKKDHLKNDLIKAFAEKRFKEPHHAALYRFVNDSEKCIEVQPDWYVYLQQHYSILEGFCLWHLMNYLQKHNPNVPNIAGKLFEPEQRNLKNARRFWNIVFDELGAIECIYSHQMMNKEEISIDHFLPWRFITHDLLWNLIPTPKSVNSSKSDCLPDIQAYFRNFSKLQYNAFQVVANLEQSKILEDYAILFQKDSIVEIQTLSFEDFSETLKNAIVPQFQIAQNMGFIANWKYCI